MQDDVKLDRNALEAAMKAALPPLKRFDTAEAIKAAIRAYLAALAMPGVVEVKKLEWEGNCADTPFGSYTVTENVDDRWQFTFHRYPYGTPDDLEFAAAEDAMAAAQADYEARIRSALTGGEQ